MGESHYDVLGVSPHAEDVVIEGAYKALLKRYHPDLRPEDAAGATARAARITEAYRVLKDDGARARYDRDLAGRGTAPPTRDGVHPEPAPPPPAWSPARPVAPRRDPPPAARKPSRFGYLVLAVMIVAGTFGWFLAEGETPAGPALAPVAQPQAAAQAKPAEGAPPAEDSRPPVAVPRAARFATSFDCGRSSGAAAALICADAELARIDRELGARYRQRLASAAAPDALRADQRRWLAERNAAPAQAEVLMRLYRDRLLVLGSEQAIAEQIY